MNTFTESNTVEQMILDAAKKLGGDPSSANWSYSSADQVPRQPTDVMAEPWLRKALIRLNPEISAQPDRADEALHDVYPSIRCTEDDYHE